MIGFVRRTDTPTLRKIIPRKEIVQEKYPEVLKSVALMSWYCHGSLLMGSPLISQAFPFST